MGFLAQVAGVLVSYHYVGEGSGERLPDPGPAQGGHAAAAPGPLRVQAWRTLLELLLGGAAAQRLAPDAAARAGRAAADLRHGPRRAEPRQAPPG